MKHVARKSFFFSGMLIANIFGGAQAATIIVNPGQSIQTAVNSAVAGDIVQVKAGTYNQKILISGKNGNADNFITIKGDAGAVITGAGLVPAGREGLISIKNSSYIKIDGFEIANFTYNGSNTPVGISRDRFTAPISRFSGIRFTVSRTPALARILVPWERMAWPYLARTPMALPTCF